jgi:hypothetical protein
VAIKQAWWATDPTLTTKTLGSDIRTQRFGEKEHLMFGGGIVGHRLIDFGRSQFRVFARIGLCGGPDR